jgi:hypothetical protein
MAKAKAKARPAKATIRPARPELPSFVPVLQPESTPVRSIDAQVADLLAQSMVAHREAKQCLTRRDRRGALVLWKEARARRKTAHGLDPLHTSPAWSEEQKHTPTGKDTHDELCQFYDRQIAKEPA